MQKKKKKKCNIPFLKNNKKPNIKDINMSINYTKYSYIACNNVQNQKADTKKIQGVNLPDQSLIDSMALIHEY